MTSGWNIASAVSSSPVRSYEMVNFKCPPAAAICDKEEWCWSHSRKHAFNHFVLLFSNYSAFKGKDFEYSERTCGWYRAPRKVIRNCFSPPHPLSLYSSSILIEVPLDTGLESMHAYIFPPKCLVYRTCCTIITLAICPQYSIFINP